MSSSDDRRRYLILGSVFIEVVAPLLRKKMTVFYQNHVGSFQDFLNSQTVKHVLFHLRHRNNWCCVDKRRCTNGKLPLYHSQWELLYTENPGQAAHNCHCKFTAKAVPIDELDITLLSVILLNCCSVNPSDEHAIRKLRQFKNELFSHNSTGGIKQTEYDSHYGDITMFVLQLDPSKQDDLIRIANRPLDDILCTKYFTILLDIHEFLDKIGISIHQVHAMMQRTNDMMIRNKTLTEENHASLQKILTYLSNTQSFETQHKRSHYVDKDSSLNPPFDLGEDMFTIKKTIHLGVNMSLLSDVLLLDNGRMIVCDFLNARILFFHIDDEHQESIEVRNYPWKLLSINHSSVAVAYDDSNCIDIYDIDTKLKLKAISLEKDISDITKMNNKLVVAIDNFIKVIDYLTGNIIETIHIGEYRFDRIHAFGNGIFLSRILQNDNNLYHYDTRDKTLSKTLLPGEALDITFLRDGSLYVICIKDYAHSNMVHVSSFGKKSKMLKSSLFKPVRFYGCLRSCCYNQVLRKLIALDDHNVYVFAEK